MPFGLTNAPSSFQSLMNEVFRGMLCMGVLVFLYDILVFSADWTEHMEHLEAVLIVLQDHVLFSNKKKCSFGHMSVE
jgi:hypothetical protein